MILIPERSTLYILKEGNTSVEDIEVKFQSDKTYTEKQISFNGKDFVKFIQKMKIPEEYHRVNNLHIKFKAKDMGRPVNFVSQRMPLVSYTMMGERVEDLYPIAIKKVLEQNEALAERIITLEKKVLDLEEFGEL